MGRRTHFRDEDSIVGDVERVARRTVAQAAAYAHTKPLTGRLRQLHLLPGKATQGIAIKTSSFFIFFYLTSLVCDEDYS